MSMSGDEAYVLAMDYVDETLEGGGALKGDDGKSAYQSWLDLGNTGTEEDFINSLKGEKGQVGEKGETGNDGKSSYEIWLDNGNVGTEQDFLDSLKGEGTDGFSPVITENSNNTDEDYRLDIETKERKFTTPNLKADIRKNIAEHNTSTDSHNDIRIFLNELNNRLNALANSDDETLDEMKEVVAYIKDNRSLIESITTTKVNVADIIDNLTTNVSNKPLSASQGVVIKNLIDTLQSELTAHINNFDIHVTASDKTNWNNKVQRIDLSGSLQLDDYRRSVIALCNVSNYGVEINSYSFGRLIFHRTNGLMRHDIFADLYISGQFNYTNTINASILEHGFADFIRMKPCTFTYKGVKYGGVEVYINSSYCRHIVFEGDTNFSIFGLDYCTADNTIIDEEVYNSLNYDSVSYNDALRYNTKKVYTEGDIEIADVNGLQTIVDTTKRKFERTIDLSDTSIYDENKWYPCVGSQIVNGLRRLELAVQLNSGTNPSWSFHASGYSCNMDLLVKASMWGGTDAESICLTHNCKHTVNGVNPCGYSQMTDGSRPIFWLRGGGKYYVAADYECDWIPVTTEYSYGSQTVSPTEIEPGVTLTRRSTIYADLYGTADIANKAYTLIDSMSLKTIDVPTNYIYDVISDKEGNIHYGEGVGVVNLRIDFFTTYKIEASKILAIYVEADKKLKGFVWDPLIESQVVSGNTLYSFEIKDINSDSGSVAVTSCKLLYMV